MAHELGESETHAESEDLRQIVRFAQLGLRLLGILFIVDGVSGLLSNLAYQAFFDARIDRSTEVSKAAAWSVYAMYGTYLIAGLYLVMDGRWVVQNVFTPRPVRSVKATEKDE